VKDLQEKEARRYALKASLCINITYYEQINQSINKIYHLSFHFNKYISYK